ncbi:hypothetical protein V8C26DRAFT_400852 [Trichoderma gracile]
MTCASPDQGYPFYRNGPSACMDCHTKRWLAFWAGPSPMLVTSPVSANPAAAVCKKWRLLGDLRQPRMADFGGERRGPVLFMSLRAFYSVTKRAAIVQSWTAVRVAVVVMLCLRRSSRAGGELVEPSHNCGQASGKVPRLSAAPIRHSQTDSCSEERDLNHRHRLGAPSSTRYAAYRPRIAPLGGSPLLNVLLRRHVQYMCLST